MTSWDTVQGIVVIVHGKLEAAIERYEYCVGLKKTFDSLTYSSVQHVHRGSKQLAPNKWLSSK